MVKPTHAVVLGAGWIGAETARRLAQEGIQVRAVVRSRVTKVLEFAQKNNDNIQIFQGDLRCPKTAEKAIDFGSSTLICAFAANAYGATHTGANEGQPLRDFEDNALINENVIETAKGMGKDRVSSIAFSSSYFTYLALKHLGKIETLQVFEEKDLNPMAFTEEELLRLKKIQPYLWEKIVSERKYINLSKTGIKIRRFRFGNVYGDGQRHIPEHPHLFPNLFARREKFHMYGNGEQERAWIHVKDLIDGVLSCLLDQKGEGNTVFNIGGTADSGHHSLKSVLELAEKALNITIHNSNPDAPGGQSLYLSTKHAQDRLGWLPKTRLNEGMQSTLDFYKKHGLGI